MNTFERVRKVVAEMLHINLERITPETALIDDLNPDSMDIAEILLALENEFDLQIGDDVLSLRTMQQIADYVNRQKREQE